MQQLRALWKQRFQGFLDRGLLNRSTAAIGKPIEKSDFLYFFRIFGVWCLDLSAGCLDLSVGCLDLSFGCLDLSFVCLDHGASLDLSGCVV